MIPMADNMNHADVNVLCEIVTNSLHKEADEESNYFTKSKFMNDFSLAFTDEEIANYPVIKGRLSQENFKQNKNKFDSFECYRRYAETRQIWEIPFLRDAHEEDNDTDEGSSDSDDLNEDETTNLDSMANALKDIITKDASKKLLRQIQSGGGLKFFVRQEEKMLENTEKLQN